MQKNSLTLSREGELATDNERVCLCDRHGTRYLTRVDAFIGNVDVSNGEGVLVAFPFDGDVISCTLRGLDHLTYHGDYGTVEAPEHLLPRL